MLKVLGMIAWLLPTLAMAEPYSETGLPLPRFVSLKSANVNMRKGPGVRYPIHWIYKRKHLPMEIINEFGHWRQVRDAEGITGWMNKGMVSAARYAMVQGEEAQSLYSEPDDDSDALLKLQPSVIMAVKRCDANWCEVDVSDHQGWISKTSIWGVYPQEVIE